MSVISSRESFVQKKINPKTIIKTLFWYGFKSFGTMKDQIESHHQKFVDDQDWLNDTQYKEIVRLCQALPGPIANQIIILVTTLTTKSALFGFLGFVAFCLPSAILLVILGVFMNHLVEDYGSVNVYIRLTVLGFKAAGAALLVRRALGSIKQYVSKIFALSIIVTSAIMFFLFPTIACINWCFLLGVLISLYVKTQKKTRLSKNVKILIKNIKNYSWLFGKWAIIICISLYIFLAFAYRVSSNQAFRFAYVFYFVGVFIFGPSTTIFPLLYPSFIEIQHVSDHHYWFGVPLCFLVPGSPTNVAIYYGTLLYGVIGGLVAWVLLHLPSFLILYGILPSWDSFRDRAGIQRIIIGMNCVALGFLLASGIIILNHTITIDYGIPITVFIISLFLSFIGFPTYQIVIIGGLLANARRWGLVAFRGVIPPDY